MRDIDGAPVFARLPHVGSDPLAASRWLARDRSASVACGAAIALAPISTLDAPEGQGTLYADPGAGPFPTGPSDARESFLRAALAVARALEGLHATGLVHRRLSPEAVLLSPDRGAAWLTDLGHAAPPGAPAAPPLASPQRLAWIAPEQTGRLGRDVGERADLYSLGLILYHLVAGRPPFAGHDAASWLHAHLAVPPRPLGPPPPWADQAILDLVSRLLAKDPGDRYPSAAALRADLERLLGGRTTLAAGPATAGASTRSYPASPSRLAGREAAAARLAMALSRAAAGSTEVVVLTGPAGIGKSSLASALATQLAQTGGVAIAAKCERQTPGAPFVALAAALGGRLRQELTRPNDEVAAVASAIRDAVGAAAPVLAELLPELVLLLGPQPAPPEVLLAEGRNRLHVALQRLAQVWARPGRPLALVVDDIQWIDDASLAALGELVTSPDSRHVLVVATARRDAESGDPRWQAIEAALTRPGDPLETIALGPLTVEQVADLAREMLGEAPADEPAFAAALHRWSGGNPLFAVEIVRALHDRGLLRREAPDNAWRADLDAGARAIRYGDVLELLTWRLGELPPATLEALEAAACIAPYASPPLLAAMLATSEEGVLAGLEPAFAAGLLVRPDTREAPFDAAVAFSHDRVLEATWDRVPPAERPRLHLAAARALRASAAALPEDRAVAQADHWIAADPAALSEDERTAAARSTLLAARRALATYAEEPAATYGEAGLAFLGPAGSAQHREIALALRETAAHAAFLRGRSEDAERHLAAGLGVASTPLERARLHQIRVERFLADQALDGAIDEGLALLDALGVSLGSDADPAAFGARVAALRARVLEAALRSLEELPACADARASAAVRAMVGMSPAVAMARPLLYGPLVATALEHVLDHGLSGAGPGAFSASAVMFALAGDAAVALRLAEAALASARRYPDDPHAAMPFIQVPVFVSPLRDLLRDTLPLLEACERRSLDAGNLVNWGFGLNQAYQHRVLAGDPLDALDEAWAGLHARLLHRHQPLSARSLELSGQLVACLRGRARESWILRGDRADLDVVRREQAAAHSGFVLHLTALFPAWLAVLHGRWDDAVAHGRAGLAHEPFVATAFPAPLLRAHLALGLLRAAAAAPPDRRAALRAEADEHVEFLRVRADAGARALRHLVAVLEAETHRLAGDGVAAAAAYDRAIDGAVAVGNPADEALAARLAGEAWLEGGQPRAACGYLLQARAALVRWGATALVAHLDAQHGERFAPMLAPASPEPTPPSVDVAALLQAAEAVTGEVVLDRLAHRLLATAIENAGATRGVLLLDGPHGLAVAARGQAAGDAVVPAEDGALLADAADVAASAVRYVQRTREPVVLADARDAALLADDPWVRDARPRSLLCAPLERGGRLVGVIHLENPLLVGAFTPERAALVQTLCTLAATAVENARLYAAAEAHARRLERAVEARTRELAQLNREHALILDSVFEGVVRLDGEGRITFVNRTAERHLRRRAADLIGRPFHGEVHVPDEGAGAGPCELCQAGPGESLPREGLLRRAGGPPILAECSRRPLVDAAGGLVGAVLTFRDVTARRSLEQQLQQAQKLQAIGQLAAGIAHDFNNLLTPILGNVEMVRGRLDPSSPASHQLDDVLRAGERAAGLVQQMLAYGRRSPMRRGRVALPEVIEGVVRLLEPTLPPDCELAVEVAPDTPPVRADAALLQQVVLNLLMNARDAVSDAARPAGSHAGRVRVSARAIALDASHVRVGHAPGTWVEVAVSDTGPGMSSADQARAFEPFWTTKPIGRGTGLGLSVVHGILEQHGGWVELQSAPGEGTTVRCFLPADRGREQAAREPGGEAGGPR